MADKTPHIDDASDPDDDPDDTDVRDTESQLILAESHTEADSGDEDDEVELATPLDDVEHPHDSDYYRSITVVPDEERITSDIMTMFEYCEVIGQRTLQLDMGCPVFTDTTGLTESYDMAIKEMYDRKSPLKIIRRTGRYIQEEWRCNEMGFPSDTRSKH